jgi:iron(III) transport system ATP-binding protein
VADFVGEGAFLPAAVTPEGLLQFELGAGRTREPYAPGAQLEVLLRPDDVLHDDASPIKARVVKKAFRGAQFLYTLALPSGREVLSLVPSHHDHAEGEAIGIRIEIDHLIAFPAA